MFSGEIRFISLTLSSPQHLQQDPGGGERKGGGKLGKETYECLRINIHSRGSIVKFHIVLRDGAAVLDWFDLFAQVVGFDGAGVNAGFGDEEDAAGGVEGL